MVTGPRTKTTAGDVYFQLDMSIRAAGGWTPCQNNNKDNLFTPSTLIAADALAAIKVCQTCPVLAECQLAGESLSKDERADQVFGGIRYNGKGEPLAKKQLVKAVRGQVSVAELEGRTDPLAAFEPGDAETDADAGVAA